MTKEKEKSGVLGSVIKDIVTGNTGSNINLPESQPEPEPRTSYSGTIILIVAAVLLFSTAGFLWYKYKK